MKQWEEKWDGWKERGKKKRMSLAELLLRSEAQNQSWHCFLQATLRGAPVTPGCPSRAAGATAQPAAAAGTPTETCSGLVTNERLGWCGRCDQAVNSCCL